MRVHNSSGGNAIPFPLGRLGIAVASAASSWPHGIIKTTPFLLTASLALVAVVARAEGDFTKTLAAGEFASAGLAKLSPEELARLEALVQRYKASDHGAAKSDPSAAAPAAKPAKSNPSWVQALITLERSATKPDAADALESRLAGSFNGWTGRSTFRLENGQLWAQVNTDAYDYAPTLKSPKVKIYPASFGSFWLIIEGVNQRCRVKPVKLD